eukprot:GGOE01031307.1.p1 GENE.GGOE01031307.1~~GGOE01031307.1.p1  ORF type:complete len:886 (-),score=253.83 GGOE01031307.1:1289-3754(-)
MEHIRSNTEANARQVAVWASRTPSSAFDPSRVVGSFNQSIYEAWSPKIRANGSINGFALTFMYPANTSFTHSRAFGMWKDYSWTGDCTYVYAFPNATNYLSDAYENVWYNFATPCLTRFLYSYDPFVLNRLNYVHDDYFPVPVPWSTKDGNAYWTFAQQRVLEAHGVTMVVQSWEVGIDWRDRLRDVCMGGSEMVVIDNADMVIATTSEADALRLDECRAKYVDGVVYAECLEVPAAEHPVEEIRTLRNALYEPLWSNVTAPAMPVSHHRVQVNGQPYMVVVATLFSSGNFRATVLWYQPWTEVQANVVLLIVGISALTVVSTVVLSVMGTFGILRPLIHLGRSMRTVAHNLKYGDGGGGASGLAQRRSIFSEVYVIQTDFETIVMDFLGFSSTRKASEEADTVLNHILKNTMADATACIHLYADGRASQVAPDLAQAVTCLARGMQWCRKRHVLMQMSTGDYLPALHPVSLGEFGEQLVRGRAVISSFPSEVVLLDEVLCDILLDNALNNAFRHGNPTGPHVQFLMDLAPPQELDTSGGQCKLTFQISNRADPAKPLVTADFIDALLNGKSNRSGELVYSSALSEHLGLHHMFKVAETHGIALTLQQDGNMVVLRAQLNVKVTKELALTVPVDLSPSADDMVLPAGLHIWALDDSSIARRLLEHSLPRHFPSATVCVLGETPDQVPQFINGAAAEADIVILDQHLDYSTQSFLGTSVLADLLDFHCRAFFCIRSASVAHGNEAAFYAAGAHCALGKDLRPDDFFRILKRMYKSFLARPTSPSVLSVASVHPGSLGQPGVPAWAPPPSVPPDPTENLVQNY